MLTAEQLEAIRQRHMSLDYEVEEHEPATQKAHADRALLLEEVERLTAAVRAYEDKITAKRDARRKYKTWRRRQAGAKPRDAAQQKGPDRQ